MLMLGAVMLIAGGIMAFMYFNNIKKQNDPSDPTGRNKLAAAKALQLKQLGGNLELTLENVGPGGVIQLQGIGLESLNLDVQIKAKHLLKQGSDRWYELEGISGAGPVHITIEDEDEIYATIKNPKLAELGLSEQDLDNLDVDSEPQITYNGSKYGLDSVEVTTFCKNGNELESENFEQWNFENEDGEEYLAVERWGGSKIEVCYSVPVKESQITIYSIS